MTMDGGHGISNLQANSYVNRRSEQEIEDQLNRAADKGDEGATSYPGNTYEQGVEAALMWAFGMALDAPLGG